MRRENCILIIDDDVWMQRILSRTLEGMGFKTYLAQNGYDGLSLAIEHEPMLIFLDIVMPEITGHTLLKIMKRIKLLRDIPILMVSGFSDTENLTLSIRMGASGFVSKPFIKGTIIDKMRDALGASIMEDVMNGVLPVGASQAPPQEEAYVAPSAPQPVVPLEKPDTKVPIPFPDAQKVEVASIKLEFVEDERNLIAAMLFDK
jgi:CheY-like chemotaxis protein